MVYHFLIVDDEYFVRQRIRLCITWQNYGFECAGEAGNVEQALLFLQNTPIDLILLDISMPGRNGLELIRVLREKNSKVKFIILSGFATFEYAKQAIALNVTNYLLKPINTDELIHTIIEIKNSLDQSGHLAQEQLSFDETRQIAENTQKNVFFQNIFSHNGSVLDNEFQKFGIFPNCFYIIIVFGGQPKPMHKLSFQEYTAFQSALGNIADNLLKDYIGYIRVTDIYDHQVLIIPTASPHESMEILPKYLSNTVKESLSREIICGYSNPAEGTAQAITHAYHVAMHFFTFRTIYGSECSKFHTEFPEKHSLEILHFMNESIRGNLLQRCRQEILDNLHTIFQVIATNYFSLPALESEVSTLLSIAVDYAVTFHVEFSGETSNSAYTAAEIIHAGYSLLEIEEKLYNLFISFLSNQDEEDLPLIHRIVMQAAELIEREYSRYDMGLQYIASVLLISPAYLSRNFKRIKKLTVMQYITQCRMEQAWNMLHDTTLPISKVAERSGYQDSFYFSKRFKVFFGMSPSQINHQE